MSEIITGAFSGVVAAAFLFLVKVLFTNYFLPSFQAAIYKGANLTGKWNSNVLEPDHVDNTKNNQIDMTLSIKQRAHDITGYLDVVIIRELGVETLNYTIKGEYSDGYLQFTCTSKRPGFTSYGTMLLRVVVSGSVLSGIMTFRTSIDDSVDFVKINLKSTPENLSR